LADLGADGWINIKIDLGEKWGVGQDRYNEPWVP